MQLQLRKLKTFGEYRKCEDLQDSIWGREDVVRVSTLVLITAQNNGGMVIGAFAGEDRLVGFVCSYPGLTAGGRVKQCSQLLAVDPGFRNGCVGYELKLAQRRLALEQGIELVTWTFDPLVTTNANLNLKKLGCVAGRYLEDCYGTSLQGLNAGLASDRLLAEWWIAAPRVERLLGGEDEPFPGSLPRVNDVGLRDGDGLAFNRSLALERDEPRLLLEVPEDVPAIKRRDPALARAWRAETRELFRAYLGRGYAVVRFACDQRAGRRRCWYLLSRVDGEARRAA